MKSWRFGQCDRSEEIKTHVSLRSADWESGGARQKYVLDQITLYHFTPLRFSIKHADGLCPGDGEFFLAIPIRCHANLQHTRVLHQSLQKMIPCSLAKETQKLSINLCIFTPKKSASVVHVQFLIQRLE